MKFFIIGFHSSGKHEVAHQLEALGMKYGKLFTNTSDININTKLYGCGEYEQYDSSDINDIFENNAYIFIHEHIDKNMVNVIAHNHFEGLSKYTYDNNDVFVLSPDQFLDIPQVNIPEDIVYVWLDNPRYNRVNRYKANKSEYNFNARETQEKRDMKDLVKTVCSSGNLLYFTNEEPGRISSIIYALHTHPDLKEVFLKNYN
jgi:hypothetical protein